MTNPNNKIDVAILGSGIASSSLALILVKNGLTVQIFDRGLSAKVCEDLTWANMKRQYLTKLLIIL